MDLARTVYTREMKVAAMRAMDAGESGASVARRLQVSPKLLERWRAEWRAQGEAAFPGQGRRHSGQTADPERQIAELERKVGQLTMDNEFLKKALAHFKEHHRPAGANGETVCTARWAKPPKPEQP
jgi:transposase